MSLVVEFKQALRGTYEEAKMHDYVAIYFLYMVETILVLGG